MCTCAQTLKLHVPKAPLTPGVGAKAALALLPVVAHLLKIFRGRYWQVSIYGPVLAPCMGGKVFGVEQARQPFGSCWFIPQRPTVNVVTWDRGANTSPTPVGQLQHLPNHFLILLTFAALSGAHTTCVANTCQYLPKVFVTPANTCPGRC